MSSGVSGIMGALNLTHTARSRAGYRRNRMGDRTYANRIGVLHVPRVSDRAREMMSITIALDQN